MKAMCAPYANVDSASYQNCLRQADKFHILAQKDHRAVSSPQWCADTCVPQKGSPAVALQAS